MTFQENTIQRDIRALEKYARLARNSDDEFYHTCRDALADSINKIRVTEDIDRQRGIRTRSDSTQTKLLTNNTN